MNENSNRCGRIYGYVRVSSRDQSEERQLMALAEYRIPPERIFIDKKSGGDFDRQQYRKLIQQLQRGDLLLIKSIDRLGRNYREVMEQWRYISQERGADIRVIDMPLLDTTRCKDLLGTFISDLVLQVLSFVAENERENIRQRQKEGIAAAKARGVQFGRPEKELSVPFERILREVEAGRLSLDKALKTLGICKSTYYNRKREYQLQQERCGKKKNPEKCTFLNREMAQSREYSCKTL